MEPTCRHRPEAALAEVNGSAEIQSAMAQGYLKFALPEETKSSRIPPLEKGSPEWLQYKMRLIAVTNEKRGQAQRPVTGIFENPSDEGTRRISSRQDGIDND